MGPIRPANPGDHDSINRLHASEFPRTYATTAQLLAEYETLVYDDVDAGVTGYASGQIQDDGTGYVDFLAVDPHARGKGIGAGLLAGLLARLDCSHFALTVAEENSTARRLFEEQGWRHEASFRAYRSQP